MAINSFDRASFAQFQPISPEMMMMPAQYMRQQEDQLSEDALQLQLLNDAAKAQLIQGVDDEAIAEANSMDEGVRQLSETLAKEGFNGAGRRSGINKLRRAYATTMLPIQQAAQNRAEFAKLQQEALLKDPTLRFSTMANNVSVRDAISNPQIFSKIQGISGAALRQQVAQKVAPIAKMLADVAPQTMQVKGPNGRPIAFQYTQAFQRGATPEEVASLMVRDGIDVNNASKISLLLKDALDSTMSSAGVYDVFTPDSKEALDLYSEAASGAYAALGSPELKNITDSYGMQLALMVQKQKAEKAAKSKTGNYYPSFYRANVASGELKKLNNIKESLALYDSKLDSGESTSSFGRWIVENLIGEPGPLMGSQSSTAIAKAKEAQDAYKRGLSKSFKQITDELKELGIDTEGKSREELIQIVERRMNDYANNQVLFSFNDNEGILNVASQVYARMNPNQRKQTIVTDINGNPVSKGDFKELFTFNKDDNITGFKGELYFSPKNGLVIAKEGELYPINTSALDAVVDRQYIKPLQMVEQYLDEAKNQVTPEELHAEGFSSYEELVGAKLHIDIPSMRRNALDAIAATLLSENQRTKYKQE